MTTAKHTPGPYYIAGDLICANTPKGQAELAKVYDTSEYVLALEAEANKHLFAAAPELVEALELYLSASPQCECSDEIGCKMAAARSKARAALAKAKGKA